MIDFLEQLEHDLVDAIDRRAGAPRLRRARPRLRLDLVAAILALAAAIALVVVLGWDRDTNNRAVEHPTTPTPPPGKITPIPKGTGVRAVGPR